MIYFKNNLLVHNIENRVQTIVFSLWLQPEIHAHAKPPCTFQHNEHAGSNGVNPFSLNSIDFVTVAATVLPTV